MTDQQLAETRAFLSRLGVSDAVITHPTTTLEDLFVRVVRQHTAAGQSSVGSG